MNRKRSLKELTPEATVGQIVNAGIDSEGLLSSIGLNPEEHRAQTLRSVCQERKWSEVELLNWLKEKDDSYTNGEKPRYEVEDNAGDMCSYLLRHFHTKNRDLLEEIEHAFPRVHQIHGNQYPWLKNIKWHYDLFREAVRLFYKFEQEKFLPLIKDISEQKSSILHGTVQRVKRCLEIVSRDHERLTKKMHTIRAKARNFENPANACTTLRIMNQNFELLFSSFDEQFEFEQKTLIPKVKEHLALIED